MALTERRISRHPCARVRDRQLAAPERVEVGEPGRERALVERGPDPGGEDAREEGTAHLAGARAAWMVAPSLCADVLEVRDEGIAWHALGSRPPSARGGLCPGGSLRVRTSGAPAGIRGYRSRPTSPWVSREGAGRM